VFSKVFIAISILYKVTKEVNSKAKINPSILTQDRL